MSYIEDPDVLPIAIGNMDELLVGGDGKLRSLEAVKKKLAGLKDNFAELERAADKNPILLSAGKHCLSELKGKSFPPGVMERLVNAANKLPIDAMAKMSASSSVMDLHKGISQFLNNVNALLNEDVVKHLEGSDPMRPCRDFAADILFARCGTSTLKNINAALDSELGSKLLHLYKDLSDGKFNKTGMSQGLITAVKDQAGSHAAFVNRMKQSVYSALALPAEGFQPVMSYEGVINYATFNAGGVLQNLIDIGKERMAGDREIFLGQLVKGTGTGAAEMKGILKRAVPDGTHDPLVFIGQRSKTCAIGMLNWAIAADCKRFAEGNGNETQFAKDLVRDHDIMLPNGKKLSQDFATACDEIAQLVTRDPTATYAKLDAKAKGKAHVVMSLLTQESLKAMTDGNALALDPKMNKPAFTTVSSQNDDKRVFHINVSSDGYFEMEITSTSNLKALMVLNDDGQYDMVTTDPAKNEMRHTLSLQIKPNEFDRLAQVDFTKFDAVAAKNAFDSKDEDTDKIGRTVNTFAPECKLNVDGVICDTAVYSSFN